jgi:hypothetical protein
MATTYQDFLTNLNQGFAGQSLQTFAQAYQIPVTFNPETNRLLVNGVPVNMANTNLQNREGELYGSAVDYQQLLAPFTNNTTSINDVVNFQPYQTPDYIKQYMQEILQRQQQTFSYSFDDDPNVIMAREQLENTMAEMAGKRGFLYGSEQQNIVGQQMQKLYPQFEQAAYQREQDFLNRQVSLAGVLMQWDQAQANNKMSDWQLISTKADFILKLNARDLNAFKAMMEQRRFEMSFQLEEKKFNLTKKQQELDIAYKKLDTLTYADKEISVLLGIPVGTKAGWVKKLIAEQNSELKLMQKKFDYDLKMQKVNAQIEKELIAEREKISLASQLKLMQLEYGYKTALMEQQEVYRRIEEAKRKAEAEAAAKAKAETKAKDESLDAMYKLTKAHLLDQFTKKGHKTVITGDNRVKAINWLYEKLANGEISREVYNRLKVEYGLPEYEPPAQDILYRNVPKLNKKNQLLFGEIAKNTVGW